MEKAANPWAITWTPDNRYLVVTHAGTHEVSVIDFPAALAKLAKIPAVLDESKPADYTSASRVQADVPNDLAFLVKGTARKLKDRRFANFHSEVEGKWDYEQFVDGSHPEWFHDWISFDCLLADEPRETIWCGLTIPELNRTSRST